MHSRSLQKAVLKAESQGFTRDDKGGTTTQAIRTSSGRINKDPIEAESADDLWQLEHWGSSRLKP
jgi:hypothetical protein